MLTVGEPEINRAVVLFMENVQIETPLTAASRNLFKLQLPVNALRRGGTSQDRVTTRMGT